jgi:thiol-disulfide isomerase/thioredoxin
VVAFVIGCLILSPAARPSPGAELPEGVPLQRFVEPVPAPAVVLSDLEGRPLTLEQFRGTLVFVNFWATWCVPCRQEMPALERLHAAYEQRGLVMLAVNFKESETEIRRFVRELRLDMTVALDRDGSASRRFRVLGLPVSLLIDRDGRILWKAIGAREWDTPEMRAYFDRMIGRP